jgi:hypothetical protein
MSFDMFAELHRETRKRTWCAVPGRRNMEDMSLSVSHWHQPLIVPLATGVLQLGGACPVDAPWAGGGAGTTNIASDGSTGRPRFEYHVNGAGGIWVFSTTARSARRIAVDWCYSGFHAWFNVRVELERFIRRGDTEVFQETLTQPGRPGSSGGFAYTGSSTFDVWPGDTYGFRMSGSDFGSMKRY